MEAPPGVGQKAPAAVPSLILRRLRLLPAVVVQVGAVAGGAVEIEDPSEDFHIKILQELNRFAKQGELSFKARLARENGWDDRFTQQVLDEYGTFCFLATQVQHPVTPSDEVDQAWHLHLQYTQHYMETWLPFLGIKLYHGPTKGGKAEAARYDKQYKQTLESYEEITGVPPPWNVWPSADIRFNHSPYAQRVNILDNYVLDKVVVHIALGIFGVLFVMALIIGSFI